MDTRNADKLYFGLDISTQQVKVILINGKLKTVYEDGVHFDSELPEFGTEGGARIQSDKLTVTSPTLMWVKALDRVLDKMKTAKINFGNIVAVSGAGQQHGSVYWAKGAREILNNFQSEKSMYDQLVNPMCFSIGESPIWMDSSTTSQCKSLEEQLGGPREVAKITGSRAYERFTGNQIAKMYQSYGQLFKKTEHISLVSSFGACLFVGDYAPIDYSDGSGMNLMDIEKKVWSDKCLDACAPNLRELLCNPVPSDKVVGKISSYMAERYGFNKECDVISFTGDNPASVAGMRLQLGDIIVSLGTSDTLFLWLSEPNPATEGHVFVNPVDSSAYMALLCYKNGSLTRENIRNTHAEGSWKVFDNALRSSSKGNGGNIGMYYDIAEITPSNACGTFRFNNDNKKVALFSSEIEIRAVIEGQFLAKRVHAEKLGYSVVHGKSRILATGGASSSSEILQVMADVFNAEVFTLDIPNSASLGSAYRAKHGKEKAIDPNVTFSSSVKEAPDYICAAKPDHSAEDIYNKMTKRYKYLEDQFIRK